MIENTIIFKNYINVNLDFSDNLEIRSTLIFDNCKNFNIKINSKINKIIIRNSSNFNLNYFKTISGLEVEKSKEVLLSFSKNNYGFNFFQLQEYETCIEHINCFKSILKFRHDTESYEESDITSGPIFGILNEKVIIKNEESHISFLIN